MKKIKLYNRDYAKLYLVSEDNKNWKFEVDDEHKYIFEYMRVGYNEDETINFIDPSGGPFISVGDNITDAKQVKSIRRVDYKFCITTN